MRALDVILRRPAAYKRPRRIWLCRKMPMTASGKVAAGELRQWIAEENSALERLL